MRHTPRLATSLAAAVLAIAAAACALQGGTVHTGPVQKVYAEIDQATRDKWWPTCNNIWLQELGRPVDTLAAEVCITQIVNGATSEAIRDWVRQSPEYPLHLAAVAAAKKAADDAAAEALKHKDPSTIPLEELAAIRGAMWPLGTASTCGALPLGPRPGQADNVLATDFITDYTPEHQACIVAELKARGYTHVVMGPLVDSDGYHGAWPPNDWRGANFERFLDALQMFWDAGLAPVVFIHPDGWTFEQTRDELTPLLRQPRAQRLLRLGVPHGWEPCKYECSSYTWAAYGRWFRETMPNALSLLHTVCDVDAPVGTDGRGDDNGTGNQTGWARVVPYYHGWLTQSCAFEHPDAHGDPNHPEKTNFDNWADLFNPNVRGSYRDRFEHGYAGWPTSSAWGPGKPLLVYAGEYSAYWRFWQHRTEAEGVAWGNRAIASGAAGYLDGGSVAVR